MDGWDGVEARDDVEAWDDVEARDDVESGEPNGCGPAGVEIVALLAPGETPAAASV